MSRLMRTTASVTKCTGNGSLMFETIPLAQLKSLWRSEKSCLAKPIHPNLQTSTSAHETVRSTGCWYLVVTTNHKPLFLHSNPRRQSHIRLARECQIMSRIHQNRLPGIVALFCKLCFMALYLSHLPQSSGVSNSITACNAIA